MRIWAVGRRRRGLARRLPACDLVPSTRGASMATTSLARDLESLFQGGSAAGLSDRLLIERFATRRDEAGEAAFAALVARHGPIVLGVCRQILGDEHLAEDA